MNIFRDTNHALGKPTLDYKRTSQKKKTFFYTKERTDYKINS